MCQSATGTVPQNTQISVARPPQQSGATKLYGQRHATPHNNTGPHPLSAGIKGRESPLQRPLLELHSIASYDVSSSRGSLIYGIATRSIGRTWCAIRSCPYRGGLAAKPQLVTTLVVARLFERLNDRFGANQLNKVQSQSKLGARPRLETRSKTNQSCMYAVPGR